MTNLYKRHLLSLICPLLVCISLPMNAVKVDHLLTEYTREPLGIDVEHPRFSWQLSGCKHQRSYQIRVVDESGREMWNTQRRQSAQSVNIVYGGQSLNPRTRYTWTVTVWGDDKSSSTQSSWFETGLMSCRQGINPWKDCRWIGIDERDNALFSPYLSVFKLKVGFQLDDASKSTNFSLFFGVNDERLMKSHLNKFGLAAPRDSSYLRLEWDATQAKMGGAVRLRLYRVGYAPQDRSDIAIGDWTIPDSIAGGKRLWNPHHLIIMVCLGETTISVDGLQLSTVSVNPLGKGADYISFPVLADVGLRVPARQRININEFSVGNYRRPGNKIVDVPSLCGKFDGRRLGCQLVVNPSVGSMPILRTRFACHGAIKKARIYATARGIYDLWLNGQRVDNGYLHPDLTQYNKTLMYQTYDVTSLVKEGDNAIGAQLSEGWWAGHYTFQGQNWNYFGDQLAFLAQLVIIYADGTEQIVGTQPDLWRYTTNGPLCCGSLYQGEVYDSRAAKMLGNWSSQDYSDSQWHPAQVKNLEGHVGVDGWSGSMAPNDYSNFHIVAQSGPTVNVFEHRQAQSVSRVADSVYIYDMGQNLVGVPDIDFGVLASGERITMRYAEVLYPDMPEYKGLTGTMMMENIRAAMATDQYIADGNDSHFTPRFTLHGYRYVEISGLPHALPLSQVGVRVLSSINGFTADYHTSDSLVNRLWQNIRWSTLGNFVSIPTDCPQRNERMGWAGDISVYSNTATYMSSVPLFLCRYLRCMRDVQLPNGKFQDIAPIGGGFGGMLWGSAGITVPWEIYQQYADTVCLAEHYQAMKRYIDFLFEHDINPNNGILWQNHSWADLDDWLGPEHKKNDNSLLWECYLCYDLDIMRHVAGLLNQTTDSIRYDSLLRQRKKFFVKTYVDAATGMTLHSAYDPDLMGKPVDTQTSYVLPLAFHIVDGPLAEKMTDRLLATLRRSNTDDQGRLLPPYSLMTGFIGTAWISKVLSDRGHSQEAYRLLLQRSYPSWLYPVTQGATTIWERLNSYTKTEGFGGNNNMNSFNHYSFGAVGGWMLSRSLGISRDVLHPGFSHFLLQPEPDKTGALPAAEGYYDSPYGRIESSWKVNGDESVDYHFIIPVNTSAHISIEASSSKNVMVNDKPLSAKRCKAEAYGRISWEAEPGEYTVRVKK
jgi:alpha-L-rhamnosidase